MEGKVQNEDEQIFPSVPSWTSKVILESEPLAQPLVWALLLATYHPKSTPKDDKHSHNFTLITCNLNMIKHDYSCDLRHKTLHLCACYHTLSAFLSFYAYLCHNLKMH